MEVYSYSKDTIRKALSLLEMDGYIQKKQGKSSIVIEHGLMKDQYLSEIKTAGELNKDHSTKFRPSLLRFILFKAKKI